MYQRDIRHTGRAVVPDFSMAPPSLVNATDGNFYDRVRVNWRSLHGATSYEVWRMNASDLFEVTMVGTTTGSTNFDDVTAVAGVTYFFFVRGINRAGSSAFSIPDSGYHLTPPSLQAMPGGNQMLLSWPTSAVGFALQSTLSLTPPVTWSNIGTAPALFGGRWTVTNSFSASNKFFRLYKP
jgi:hypothetical protein